MTEPLSANMVWQVPDNHTITVTLFRDPRTRELEDKDWTFAIEDVSYLSLCLFIEFFVVVAMQVCTFLLIRRRLCKLSFRRSRQWERNEFLRHTQ